MATEGFLFSDIEDYGLLDAPQKCDVGQRKGENHVTAAVYVAARFV